MDGHVPGITKAFHLIIKDIFIPYDIPDFSNYFHNPPIFEFVLKLHDRTPFEGQPANAIRLSREAHEYCGSPRPPLEIKLPEMATI
jgi:hypothetical protein